MIGTIPTAPPLWTSINAVKSYYEHTHMTDKNHDLISELFTEIEIEHIKAVKEKIEAAVPKWVLHDPYVVIAGGCFASALQSTMIKDFDIFVLGDRKHPDIEKEKFRSIRQKMRVSLPEINDKTDDYSRNNSAVAAVWTEKKRKMQFIYTHHDTREELLKDFDYLHCTVSYYLGKLYISRQIYDAVMERKLIVNNDKNIQQWRREKFISRGYKEVGEEMTVGNILAGALKRVAQTSYVSYEDDDEFSWLK